MTVVFVSLFRSAGLSSGEVVARTSSRGRTTEIATLSGRPGTVFCDVEAQCATRDFAPVELLNSLLRVLLIREPNEREASWAPRFAVLWNVDVYDLTDLAEELTELFVRRGKVEVPYEYLA